MIIKLNIKRKEKEGLKVKRGKKSFYLNYIKVILLIYFLLHLDKGFLFFFC